MLPSQLPLSLKLPQFTQFENFFPANNAIVIDALKKLVAGNGEKIIYLHGAEGLGKTHLLQAACHTASLENISAVYLPLKTLHTFGPGILEGLESLAFIAIDNVEVVARDAVWNEALFHLYNRLLSQEGRLLIAGLQGPSEAGFKLPDLISRLKGCLLLHLQALKDADKFTALQLHAKMRGLELSEEVGDFLMKRCPRDLPSLIQVLDELDKMSLAAQRKLTIPFVKQVLGI